jgi:hypothetical protein
MADRTKLTATIVCCHSVFHGTDPLDESHWGLAPFQKATANKPSENVTFMEHIRIGLRTLLPKAGVTNEQNVLIFSGGPTNSSHPGKTEADGYFRIAQVLIQDEPEFASIKGLFDWKSKAIILEERATDSFQNIQFGILRCKDELGRYPDKLIAVTHNFKEERFNLHRKAAKWTREWELQGVDPPFDGEYRSSLSCFSLISTTLDEERALVIKGEGKNALEPFKKDLYGVRSPLNDKRVTRMWNDETLDIVSKGKSEAVRKLVVWRGGEAGDEVFPEKVDWEF